VEAGRWHGNERAGIHPENSGYCLLPGLPGGQEASAGAARLSGLFGTYGSRRCCAVLVSVHSSSVRVCNTDGDQSVIYCLGDV